MRPERNNDIDTISDIVKKARRAMKKAPKTKYFCLIYKNGKLLLRVEKKCKKDFKGIKAKYSLKHPYSEITVSEVKPIEKRK